MKIEIEENEEGFSFEDMKRWGLYISKKEKQKRLGLRSSFNEAVHHDNNLKIEIPNMFDLM